MSHRFWMMLVIAVLATAATQAQVLTPLSAREGLPAVESRAKTDLGTDAVITNVLFAGLEYQGMAIAMDISTGKSTGWVYRAYAPSVDSSILYIAVKLPVLGVQVVTVPLDTITRLIPGNVSTLGLVEPWVDSPEGLAGSKSGGADAFLTAHPGATLALAAVVNNPLANPVMPLGEFWFFRYIAPDDTLTCLVWADSGSPLRCTSSNMPHFVSIPVTQARVGVAYAYDADATGTPPPLFSLTVKPDGMTIDEATGAISWTPTAVQLGTNSVTIRAENANGFDLQQFVVQVQPAVSAPRIQSTPPLSVNAGEAYLYQVVASGSPAPTYTLDRGPAGMTIDARGNLAWMPSRAHAGVHAITVTARNAGGSDSQSWDLTVNASPRLAFIVDQTAHVDSLFVLRASADGYPAPRFALLSAPASMTVDADSGIVRWTPGSADGGPHAIRLEARNSAGVQEQSFTVTVSSATSVEGLTIADFRLLAVHPHPLVAGTSLVVRWEQAARSDVRVAVRDLLGRDVRELGSGSTAAGSHDLVWDGHDDAGRPVAAGTYILELRSGRGVVARPLLVLP